MSEAKKRFLALYVDNAREIARLEEELKAWESMAERATASFSEMPRGAGEDRIQRAVEQLDELRGMLAARWAEAVGIRLAIERAIEAVDDARLRLLLRYRYVDGMSWDGIAEEMHIDDRWVYRLHKRALAQIEAGSARG